MIVEYPDYYDRFQCEAGDCPDTCCAGWEVDVDEETYYRYQVVPGEFGDKLRSDIQDNDGEYSFVLTKDERCPFLDPDNLCDIYKQLGGDALCQTCQEHPRFYTEIGEYEQVDLSLSCPGVAKLFFESPRPFKVVRHEDDRPGTWLSVEDSANLEEILAFRDSAMGGCQEGSSSKHFQHFFAADTDARWAAEFKGMEALEPSWSELTARIAENYSDYQNDWPKVYNVAIERWFRKLGAYFSFRYYIDSWFDGSLVPEKKLIKKSLWFLRLMCIDRWRLNGGEFLKADLMDVVRQYSKEVEFSEENVKVLKEIQ